MPSYDATYFVAVVCLPLLVRLLMIPRFGEPVRELSIRVGERLWAHFSVREIPDEIVLRQWAQTRRSQLERRLALVRQLVLTDDAMSATRQTGNRMAYERLRIDVAAAVAAAPERLEEPAAMTWQPSPFPARSLRTSTCTGSPTVEVLELGPPRRSR